MAKWSDFFLLAGIAGAGYMLIRSASNLFGGDNVVEKIVQNTETRVSEYYRDTGKTIYKTVYDLPETAGNASAEAYITPKINNVLDFKNDLDNSKNYWAVGTSMFKYQLFQNDPVGLIKPIWQTAERFVYGGSSTGSKRASTGSKRVYAVKRSDGSTTQQASTDVSPMAQAGNTGSDPKSIKYDVKAKSVTTEKIHRTSNAGIKYDVKVRSVRS